MAAPKGAAIFDISLFFFYLFVIFGKSFYLCTQNITKK